MAQILCSTGALIGRPNHRDYHLIEKIKGQLKCDGFEFMMYSTWYDEAERIADYLIEQNINIPVMHCEKHIGEAISKGTKEDIKEALELFKINCHMAEKIGAEKMVIHLWDGITSDANFVNNLKTYRELDLMAKEHHVDLLVENVVCIHDNPMKHWCELAKENPDIHFIFDTKMAAFHNQETLLYQEEYSWLWREKHIRHFHVNDYNGGYMEWDKLCSLPIGKGHIDFNLFFDFIRKIGYDSTFTVEATAFNSEGMIDVEMLNGCFAKIRNYM